MDIEYVISLADDKISGYRKWLIQNTGKFPLQTCNELKVKDAKNHNHWIGKSLNFYSK